MQFLFPCKTFTGFGPNSLETHPTTPPVRTITVPRGSALRQHVRVQCPRLPGVYGMLDGDGVLIYVGKAKCLRSRLLSYFRTKSRDPKAGRILRPTRTLVWEVAPSEFGALLRELELIRRWRPRFNVQGQPKRGRRVFVCVGGKPAPYLFLSAQPPKAASVCYGPVRAGRHVVDAVRRLNDWYRLRDCPQAQQMVFADQGELFPTPRTAGCLRLEIGTCLGPCAAACTQPAYAAQVRAVRGFLAGTDLSPIERLEREMQAASASLEFERAAALRDRLESIRWLHEQLERLRGTCAKTSFVYPITGQDGVKLWYLIHGGRVVLVTPPPTDTITCKAAASAIEKVYQHTHSAFSSPRPTEMDGVFLVASWFRRYPEQRAATLSPAKALSQCTRRRTTKTHKQESTKRREGAGA